jgi:hypothetical protein
MTLFNGEERRNLLDDYVIEKELGAGKYLSFKKLLFCK